MRKFCSVILFLFCLGTIQAQPTISSFSPSSGSVGTLVTIIGTNLGNPTAFTIGGVTTIMVSDTSVIAANKGDTLVGLVMPGAVSGIVSVTTAAGTANGSNNFIVTATPHPSQQQGNKLVGTGATGKAQQGCGVSLSADGNTAIVGGAEDNSESGAVWIYSRSGGVWAQQGSKLVGTGALGVPLQGCSVAISADGNTAIVGGPYDNSYNSYTGAIWVYTRSGGVWTQQGSKLVGTGSVGHSSQGFSVAISADGNTAIVGGYNDDYGIGAAWVYARSGGIWTQQGSKLVGTGAINGPYEIYQGQSVAISANGNTAIVGGPDDNNYIGAAWVYTRTGGVWTQQGNKLVGTGALGPQINQGQSVALSADGNTAIVGGPQDNNDTGAIWVYTRTGGVWTQQGSKLVGTGAGTAGQGGSVSVSADGNTAIVGGGQDSGGVGAVWVYTRTGGVWTQRGNKLVGTGVVGAPAYQGFSISLSADGNTAIVGGIFDNYSVGAAWVFVPCTFSDVTPILNQNVLCFGESNGSATAATPTGGMSPYTYSWSSGGGTNLTASDFSAGTYTITITDNNGCSVSASTNITQPNILSSSAIATLNVSCYSGNNGIALANSSGGTSPYTYSWSPDSQINNVVSGLSAGTYTVFVTDNNGCSVSASTTITQPNILSSAAIATLNVSCYSGNNGIASANPSGGTSPYTYSWSQGSQTNKAASGLTAGTYTVVVIDAHGCAAASASIAVITQPVALNIIGNVITNVGCYGGNNGSATVSSSGGISPYTYSWLPIGGSGVTGTYLYAGTYVIACTDSNGCVAMDTLTIQQPPSPAINICCDSTITPGQNVELMSSGGNSYSWSPSAGLSCDSCNNPIASPSQTTTYTVTISDSNCVFTRTVTIDVSCGEVFVPTAFSPNEPHNNILYVRGICIAAMDFLVFDRWGNKVFESQKLNDGWNGTYNGQPMNMDTYVWYLKATLNDGTSVEKKGNVTLVR